MPSTAAPCPDPALLAADRPGEAGRRERPLESTVAVITGGGRGIGRMVAESLTGSGASVGLIARSATELTDAARAVEAAGGTAEVMTADVTDAVATAEAIGALRHRLGPIDLLVNNAGAVGPIGPLWDVDADAWWATFDVNLRGTLLCSQLVLPEMVTRGRGRIINITSQAGAHRWPLVSAYSVSKAAVIKLTENLARETARHGVSVFSVHPGLLPIGMSETVLAIEPTTAYEAHIRRWTETSLDEGDSARPEQAIELIGRLAAGDGDGLSGRHLSVHDDLDAVLARLPEVRERDLYVMRPERLRRTPAHR